MRGLRFDRLMSGVALALPLTVVLAIPPSNAQTNTAAIESAVPMPEATTVAPPTATDAAPATTQGIGTQPEGTPAPAETATPAAPAAAPAATPAETATAPAAEPPPDPLASLDPADRPIAEKLRDTLPKADRTVRDPQGARSRSRRSTRSATTSRCGSSAASSARAPMPR